VPWWRSRKIFVVFFLFLFFFLDHGQMGWSSSADLQPLPMLSGAPRATASSCWWYAAFVESTWKNLVHAPRQSGLTDRVGIKTRVVRSSG